MSNINKFSQGIGLTPQSTPPLNPSEGTVYYDSASDQALVYVNGNWIPLTEVDNYILNPGAEVNTTGWATYADAAGTIPVDGTGGTANITWTRTTTLPIMGAASFLFTKDAANRQGQGTSYNFKIDRGLRGEVLQIKGLVELVSGTYDNDLIAYIYDVTNSRLIEPAGMIIQVGAKISATFQASSDSVDYRLIIHQTKATTQAYTLKMDGFSVGSQVTTTGYAASDLKTYNPVIGAITTPPTLGTNTSLFSWRQIGDCMEINGSINQSTAGTGGSGSYLIPIPSGYTIDATKINVIASGAPNLCGTASGFNGAALFSGYVSAHSATALSLNFGDANNAIATWGSGFIALNNASVRVSFQALVPIVGWSSNTIASADTDSRVVAAGYGGSTSTVSNAGFSLITYTTANQIDTHGAYNTATGKYTVKVPGKYRIKGQYTMSVTPTSTNASLTAFIFVNAISKFVGRTPCGTVSASSFTAEVNGTLDLKVGDEVQIYGNQQAVNAAPAVANGADVTYFEIVRESGPSQVTETANVSCSYFVGATSMPSATMTTPNLTKEWDSHNAMTAGTATYTAPVSGEYDFTGKAITDGVNNWTVGAEFSFVAGANRRICTGAAQVASAYSLSTGGSLRLMLKQGETVQVRLYQTSATTKTTITGTNFSSIQIKRVGNYA